MRYFLPISIGSVESIGCRASALFFGVGVSESISTSLSSIERLLKGLVNLTLWSFAGEASTELELGYVNSPMADPPGARISLGLRFRLLFDSMVALAHWVPGRFWAIGGVLPHIAFCEGSGFLIIEFNYGGSHMCG